MAELAVIGLMISSTSTAAGILGLIKRRCGASESVVSLINKCKSLISCIHELLNTLEDSVKVSHDTSSMSIALKQRSEEFQDIKTELDKVNRRTKRASDKKRGSLTHYFIMAQGWKQKLEGIYWELRSVRQGVETLVTVWENRRAVMGKVEQVVAIDTIQKTEERNGMLTWSDDCENDISPASSGDRMLLTLLELSSVHKKALAKYGQLDKLSLPDALLRTSRTLEKRYKRLRYAREGMIADRDTSFRLERVCVRMLRFAAELNNPDAHFWLGLRYLDGEGVTGDKERSVSHFKVSSAAGDGYAMWILWKIFFEKGLQEQVLKYMRMCAENGSRSSMRCLVSRLSNEQGIHEYAVEAKKWYSRCKVPVCMSLCHFFGVGVERSGTKAEQFCYRLNEFDNNNSDVHLWISGNESNRSLSWWSQDFEASSPFGYFLHYALHQTISSDTQIGQWIEYLFDAGLHTIALTLEHHLFQCSDPKKLEKYGIRVANDGNITGHLALAAYYSHNKYQQWYRVEQHLRIAAQAGHIDAQFTCRTLFSTTGKVSRGVRDVDYDERRHQRRMHELSITIKVLKLAYGT